MLWDTATTAPDSFPNLIELYISYKVSTIAAEEIERFLNLSSDPRFPEL